MLRWLMLPLLLLSLCLSFGSLHGDSEIEDGPVTVSLVGEELTIQPGRPFYVALHFGIEADFHAYWKNPGSGGVPPQVSWSLPEGFEADELLWPTPQRFDVASQASLGYGGSFTLLAKITPPQNIDTNDVPLSAEVSWVACSNDSCVPGEASLSVTVPVADKAPASNPEVTELFAKARSSLPHGESDIVAMTETKAAGIGAQDAYVDADLFVEPSTAFDGGLLMALTMAFVGGMILNLMPCVLPVISFKILSFVKLAGQSRRQTLFHGLAFTAGVMLSFWLLAAGLLILQTYGQTVGWGFQLQEPIFVAVLAAVILIFGLSLFGVFEMGTSVASWADNGKGSQEGLMSSLFGGVIATAVATPCTGPFLGSAVGFAVTQPPFISMLVFTVLGAGMSLPYLLLAACPSLLRFMPKPGPWMVVFKELMGFIMLATVFWLLWVFTAQTTTLSLFGLLAALFVFSFTAWVWGQWCHTARKKPTRITGYVATAILALIATNLLYSASSGDITADGDEGKVATTIADVNGGKSVKVAPWESFSPEKVRNLQKEGKPVLIDFTAKWCLICQANHMVLSVDSVTKKIDELGVVKMKADWTRNDPIITRELRKWGRNGVPLYLLYDGSSTHTSPQILPQVLTPDNVLEALNKIGK